MRLKEALKEAGIDTEALLKRFGGSEDLIIKFMKRFPTDPTFPQLGEAVDSGDIEAVLRAAHTLKGISGNLGMDSLYSMCSELVDNIRNKSADLANVRDAYAAIAAEYSRLTQAIENLG